MKRNVALKKEDNCDSEDTKISEDLSNEEDQSQRLDNKLSYKTAAPTHTLPFKSRVTMTEFKKIVLLLKYTSFSANPLYLHLTNLMAVGVFRGCSKMSFCKSEMRDSHS